MSRRESPSRFAARTTRLMAMPGKTTGWLRLTVGTVKDRASEFAMLRASQGQTPQVTVASGGGIVA